MIHWKSSMNRNELTALSERVQTTVYALGFSRSRLCCTSVLSSFFLFFFPRPVAAEIISR